MPDTTDDLPAPFRGQGSAYPRRVRRRIGFQGSCSAADEGALTCASVCRQLPDDMVILLLMKKTFRITRHKSECIMSEIIYKYDRSTSDKLDEVSCDDIK